MASGTQAGGLGVSGPGLRAGAGVLTPLPASATEGLGLTSSSSQWGLADPPEGPSPKVGSLSCHPGARKEAPPQADCISICVLMRFHDSLRCTLQDTPVFAVATLAALWLPRPPGQRPKLGTSRPCPPGPLKPLGLHPPSQAWCALSLCLDYTSHPSFVLPT